LHWSEEGESVTSENIAPLARELLGRTLPQAPLGTLRVESTIPSGAGLGSSAALSVALTRWLQARGATIVDVFAFARDVESRFHGTSSGMDIAAVLSATPIVFRRGQAPEPLPALPAGPLRFTLHDTGLRSATRDCVAQVDQWRLAHPEAAGPMDAQMALAVDEGRRGFALAAGDPAAACAHFCRSFALSTEVFVVWGLLPEAVRSRAEELRTRGAEAVRLTGAGRGGTLVALWKNT
jgi:mevalonate kinase